MFLSPVNAGEYFALKDSGDSFQKQLDCIEIFLEAKGFKVDLDKASSKKELAPHFQLVQYLQMYKKSFGFLTNGQLWRFYDNRELTQNKSYVEINLSAALQLPQAEKVKAISLFLKLFAQHRYIKNQLSHINEVEQFAADAYAYATDAEENLKSVIYGTNGEDSMFELIGKSLHRVSPDTNPVEIYENSIILLFRLLFIVYFEDNNKELLTGHDHYAEYSLQHIFDSIGKEANSSKHNGFKMLGDLFRLLDEGDENIDFPLFNGGLFDPERAQLLNLPKIFDNGTLQKILEQLLYKTLRKTTLFEHRRDYRNISVTHLGRIYEGLLEYSFQVPLHSTTYLVYQIGSGAIEEAYFDDYDLAELKNQKGFKAIHSQQLNKGEFILKNANNSRKSSASYYTPTSLTQFLVKSAVDTAIAQGKSIEQLKVIDNACGSGHFLVEALNYLTYIGMITLPDAPALQKIIASERKKIEAQITNLNIKNYEIKDEQILKRALLKRCIYGLDLNPFAVELSRLSLWIDSFIFGTPLSFIEHHIQHGNALIGSTEKEFLVFNQEYESKKSKNLAFDFEDSMDIVFTELADASENLNNLQDTSTADVKKSKVIWRTEIKPKLEQLSRSLSLVSMLDIMDIEGSIAKVKKLQQLKDLKLEIFFGTKLDSKDEKKQKQLQELFAEIESHQKRFGFFHYEVAFPEARNGFDVIVGNPPWDKTKFSDTDFFPYFKSRYRSMSAGEKKVIRENLLNDPAIKADYEERSLEMTVVNEYYKKAYPLNSGSGDGNLFRFFVERNLSLLAPGGSLNYVLPSALMFEEGSEILRHEIFKSFQMSFFYSFENREGLFPDVHRAYKFAMMQVIRSTPSDDDIINSAFYLTNPVELQNSNRKIDYPVNLLKKLSPDQWSMMELRNEKDLVILEKCYMAYSPLDMDWLDFRRELDMTNDKDLFIENHVPEMLPLFEGKMIWQFDDRVDSAKYWLNLDDFDTRLRTKEIYRMAQDTGLSQGDCESFHGDAVRYDREYFRFGFRAVASDTNERTLIASMLPKNCGAGNSIYVSIPKKYSLQKQVDVSAQVVAIEKSPIEMLFSCSWFNSIVTDWMIRFMVQMNVNKTYITRIPMPQPTASEILANPDYFSLAKNALLLTLASDWDAFKELTSFFNIEKGHLPNTEKDKDKLRHQNDVIIAKLYGINDEELQHVLEGFEVMKNKRPGYLSLFG